MPRSVPRILYLLSHPIQYQSPLLRYLANSGQVDVHTIYGAEGGVRGLFDEGFGKHVTWDVPLTEGYSHEFLPSLFGRKRVGRFTPWSRGLGSTLRRVRPDAVWVHGYDQVNSVRLIALAKGLGIPVMARAEVEQSDAHGRPSARFLKDRTLRLGYKAVDAFLAIGASNEKFYLDRGVPRDRIFSTPYAVDNARFQEAWVAAQNGSSLAADYDLPSGRTIFLLCGKLIPRKRPLDSLRALALILERGASAALLIVGSGELLENARRLATALGIEDSVRFAGFLNQKAIADCYARADALLLTSERERWGLVANEAMAAGCPVISYDSAGCSNDLVLHGVSGCVVPTGDVFSLARSMVALCDSETRGRLSGGAVARVADFSFEAIELGLKQAVAAVTS
jgi:glycosyltransferase involved in cell wall biosynthesis